MFLIAHDVFLSLVNSSLIFLWIDRGCVRLFHHSRDVRELGFTAWFWPKWLIRQRAEVRPIRAIKLLPALLAKKKKIPHYLHNSDRELPGDAGSLLCHWLWRVWNTQKAEQKGIVWTLLDLNDLNFLCAFFFYVLPSMLNGDFDVAIFADVKGMT